MSITRVFTRVFSFSLADQSISLVKNQRFVTRGRTALPFCIVRGQCFNLTIIG
ncbi:hypothetical protein LZ30DRAFT_723868 [Colletotrichum cereale]|nr:hypothetical protein LZ30DRAFT_723868 [Colletotrichum cereale]